MKKYTVITVIVATIVLGFFTGIYLYRINKIDTTQIETEKLDNVTYKYYYDYVGNITRVTKGSNEYRSYEYDHKNQLIKEVNSNGVTNEFSYDNLGNIAKKVQSGTSGTTTVTYNYGKDTNAGWNHILTSVDLNGDTEILENEKIKYDAIGNPTKYLGASLTWSGRELTGYTVEDNTQTTENEYLDVKYTYDSEGLRATKTVTKNDVETKHTYHYVSGQLRYEERGKQRFYYYYDATGNLSAIRYYNDAGTASIYFVLTNSQGDVMSIYSKAGSLVASYEYDAWGNCKITKDSDGIGALNPIRYRGYYYDSETGLYYLQSRYYNPQVGRFLNADGYVTTGQGATSYNMFAYCGNNPVNRLDLSGKCWEKAKKWITNKWDEFTTWCSEIISPQHDVPLYDQGATNLCWAYSQTMVEDSIAGRTRTQAGADERARELGEQRNGVDNWSDPGFPSNVGNQISVDSFYDIAFAVIDAPVYATYNTPNSNIGHMVVVTGVDLKNKTIFVNNPWNISGELSYDDFLQSFPGENLGSEDYSFTALWDVA